MKKQKVLFIGLVWPEPQSSAAGTRILQLLNCFEPEQYTCYFASAAQWSTYSFPLQDLGVEVCPIKLNDNSFDQWVAQLQPNIVIFDRFITEEQYGWRVRQNCPNTLLLLDTEDLHLLRKGRENAYKQQNNFETKHLYNEIAKREIASILRCDLSIIISQAEIKLLTATFQIAEELLFYLPFMEDELDENKMAQWTKFEDRTGFVFIGNFIHEPNWQAVLSLKNEIWPIIRKKAKQATLHIYGAYPSHKVLQLHQEKDGFLIEGRTENALASIAQHRVMLAPLSFGAGAKGKLIDAMQSGTPSVTSSIGAEGMHQQLAWPGYISDNKTVFCEQALALYTHKDKWMEAQKNIAPIINQLFARQKWKTQLLHQINTLQANLTQHREQNFIGEILRHHSLQSTKYLSLWIAEKEKNKKIDTN